MGLLGMRGVCLALCDLRHGRTARSRADQRGRLGPRLTRSRRLCLRSLTWATSLVAFLLGPPMRLDTTRAPSRTAGLSLSYGDSPACPPGISPFAPFLAGSIMAPYAKGGTKRANCWATGRAGAAR